MSKGYRTEARLYLTYMYGNSTYMEPKGVKMSLKIKKGLGRSHQNVPVAFLCLAIATAIHSSCVRSSGSCFSMR